MVLSLPDVTLCAVTSINHELTVQAIDACLTQCSFADVFMIATQPVKADFRVEIIPPFAGHEYAPIVCRTLAKHTSSAFNLLIQYDGYIIEPLAWTDRFLEYDYIGAQWPWRPEGRRVGNSGFCLRSKKLFDVLATMPLPPAGQFVDDQFICDAKRTFLEQTHKINIAPEAIADRFAYERHKPEQPTFGFHGIFNFWRHKDDADMLGIPALLDNYYFGTQAYAEVLFHYFAARKFAVLNCWYRPLRERLNPPELRTHLLGIMNEPAFIDELLACGERLTETYPT